jgi:hypothetical protein
MVSVTTANARPRRPWLRFCWLVLTLAALLRIELDLHFVRPIAWDEAEFGRATNWIAQGRLPYRDFWEHHTPLQWFVFAPLRAVISEAGVTPLLAQRWAQLPLWSVAFALLAFIAGRVGLTGWRRWTTLLLLVLSPAFEWSAIEYRVDTPGILLLLAAIALFLSGTVGPVRWICIGMMLSLSVLANMRLAPLAIVIGALMLSADIREHRWHIRAERLWLGAGLVAVLAVTATYVGWTGSRASVIDCLIRYNLQSDAAARGDSGSFWRILFQPIVAGDVGAVLLPAGGIAGVVIALRHIRRPGAPQFLALLWCASVLSVYLTALHYEYHFELIYILSALMLGYALQRSVRATMNEARTFRSEVIALVALTLIAALRFLHLRADLQRREIEHLDVLLRTVDRITLHDEAVWDACGYVSSRRSPYKYWFLPAGIRTLALQGKIEPYDVPQMEQDPPAAIWYSARTFYWLSGTPQLAQFVTHEYMPLHQEVWIPAMSVALPEHGRASWMVLRTGRYKLCASSQLLAHPWFHAPLQCGLAETAVFAQLHLDLHAFEAGSQLRELHLTVGGVPAANDGTLMLERGSAIDVESSASTPLAVMIVPADIGELFAPVRLQS